MADKEIKELYKLANEKFECNFKYTNKKTKQDFINAVKEHIKLTITIEKEIKYNNQLVLIQDLKKEFEVNLEVNSDLNDLNNFNNMKAAMSLLATIFISTFIGSQKVDYLDDKFIVASIIGISFYCLFMFVTFIEKFCRKKVIYLKIFYSLCLRIIKDFE